MRGFVVLASLAAVAMACGDSETTPATTTQGTGGVDDGLYHPEPNGVQITETEACERFEAAFTTAGCPITLPKCPSLIRVVPGHDPDCVMYDEGSVDGCVAFFDQQAAISCNDLTASQKACVATVYPGTEPAGCP